MEKEKLTPMEVWKEFWEVVVPTISAIPNELHQANRAYKGEVKRKSKSGERVVTLGPDRIKRLTEKYAPGRYQYHEGEPYFTKGE